MCEAVANFLLERAKSAYFTKCLYWIFSVQSDHKQIQAQNKVRAYNRRQSKSAHYGIF